MSDSRSVALEELQDEAMGDLLRRGLRWRLYLGPPLFILGTLYLSMDEAPWRRWTGAGLLLVSGAWIAVALPGVRRATTVRELVPRVLPVPVVMLLGTVGLSGGVDSPLFFLAPLVGAFLALFVRLRFALAWIGAATVAVWTLAALHWWGPVGNLVPALFGGGGSVSNGALLVAKAVTITVALGWGALIGSLMQRTWRAAMSRALSARDEVLATHEESTKQLTTLAGEIAHELKNPLASVKGLAALLEKDVEGRAGERLNVLRREVDRMQDILESFLNFSRPLVPLDAQAVSLKQVVDNVVALHEGQAREQGVTFNVEDWGGAEVKADPRKLKQVLINLVQNALEASPPGSAIDVLVARDGAAGAKVLVRDRGPGIDAARAERVFEAGVTSKPKGSGLGLTVARLLARQHGGDVKLGARDDGPGAVAELRLPEKPPEAAP
ncbi:MAG: HAMP domain-containing sensor histidine kinase [Myxococcota bacterium]